MRFDSRRFLEACYSVDLDDPDDTQWSCRVLRSIAVFDRGCGLVAGAFDSDAAESGRVRLLGVHGERGRAPSHWHRLIRAWAPRLAVESLREDRVGSSTVIHVDGDGRRLRDSRSPFVEPEALDALILMDLERVGKGVFVGVPYGGDRVPPKQVVERLSEMVWHLSADRRFRSRFAKAASHSSPETRSAAEGAGDGSRGTLASALRRIDNEVLGMRWLAAAEAARSWEGLLAGGWVPLDFKVLSGDRCLVAVGASGRRLACGALTQRESTVLARVAEGKSNKEIAYEVGVATSSVADSIRACKEKFGVGSRQELIEMWAGALPRARSGSGG